MFRPPADRPGASGRARQSLVALPDGIICRKGWQTLCRLARRRCPPPGPRAAPRPWSTPIPGPKCAGVSVGKAVLPEPRCRVLVVAHLGAVAKNTGEPGRPGVEPLCVLFPDPAHDCLLVFGRLILFLGYHPNGEDVESRKQRGGRRAMLRADFEKMDPLLLQSLAQLKLILPTDDRGPRLARRNSATPGEPPAGPLIGPPSLSWAGCPSPSHALVRHRQSSRYAFLLS